MSRLFIKPDWFKSFVFIGDMHVPGGAVGQPGILTHRLDKAFAGLRALPTPDCFVQVGDTVADGNPTQDAVAKSYLDTLQAPYWTAYGNHDNYGGIRTRGDWAAFWGYPDVVYKVDRPGPGVRLVMLPFDPTPADYITAAGLVDGSPYPVILVPHEPMQNTVLDPSPTYGLQYSSATAGFFTTPDASFRGFIDAHPNIKAVVAGHTHSAIDTPGFAAVFNTGTRNVPIVNASSIFYIGQASKGQWADYMPAIVLTWKGTAIDVRYRMLGSGTWAAPDAANPAQRVTTLPTPA